MDGEKVCAGRVFEVSSERQITGRRKIKLILHEIFPEHDVWQTNGISWDEQYTMDNLGSVANMSICAEFLNAERSIPYGHGLTDIENNMPLMEDATVVGHCERAYIDDVEIDGEVKRVLVAEGYIDEIRYPKFVAWLFEKMSSGTVKGSVEIIGHQEYENRIIYDGGWKEEGRIPQIYDYGGYAILGIKPADDSAIVMELNNKKEIKEETDMDEKIKNELTEIVSNALAELNSKWDEYYAQVAAKEAEITGLQADIAEKEAEIQRLRAEFEAKEAERAAQEAGLVEANAKIAELEKEKKISELNAALADFTSDEQEIAADDIAAFKADPDAIEINSITSKICVEMVRQRKEAAKVELNNQVPDIFSGVIEPKEDNEVDIF